MSQKVYGSAAEKQRAYRERQRANRNVTASSELEPRLRGGVGAGESRSGEWMVSLDIKEKDSNHSFAIALFETERRAVMLAEAMKSAVKKNVTVTVYHVK